MTVVPAWLQQIPGVNYQPEIDLLTQFEEWAQENGWSVSDGSSLPPELCQQTDVLLEQRNNDQGVLLSIRLAVLRKARGSKKGGAIRVDASTLRTVEFLYQRRQPQWRVEAGGVRVEDDLLKRGWDWLVHLLFLP